MMIGERLKELRKKKKIKQDILAELLGLTKFTISGYEHNNCEPSDQNLVKMAKYFNISADYLLGLIDDPCSYIRHEEEVVRIPSELPEEVKQSVRDYVAFLTSKYIPEE